MRPGATAGRIDLARPHDGSAPVSAEGAPPLFPHDALVDPSSVGVDPERLRRAIQELQAQSRAGDFPGAQIALRRHGRPIANQAFGLAGGFRAQEGPLVHAHQTTPFPVFSAGKPLIALTVALLEERGLLDVRAPIADTIPEFGVRGKESITTLDVLTHTGGILMPEFSRRWQDWSDWQKVVDAICAVRPSHPRGTLAYHPLEFGWVLAEVVRRVTGRPLPEVLHEEILAPAGLAGMRFGVPQSAQHEVARSYWLGGRRAIVGSVNVAAMFTELADRPEVILSSFVPGAGLVTDAAHLAAFYDLLGAGGVAANGRRVLSAATIARYTERHLYSWCRSNRSPLAVGRGFLVGAPGPGLYGWWDGSGCYGHAGAFCTVAFADGATDLSVAIVTNGNRGPADLIRRFPGLIGRLRRVVRAHKNRRYI